MRRILISALAAAGLIGADLVPVAGQMPPAVFEDEFYVSRNAFRLAEGQFVEIRIAGGTAGAYKVRLYTASGDLVRTLHHRAEASSTQVTVFWAGTNDFGEPVAAGVYLIHAETPRWAQVRRVAVLR